jgi:predicted nuclease of predicted toxin-antitoxin system
LRYAESKNRILVSKDDDFLYLASRPNAKLRLLWVQLGNCRTSALLAAFERHWQLIESALKAGDRIIEIR